MRLWSAPRANWFRGGRDALVSGRWMVSNDVSRVGVRLSPGVFERDPSAPSEMASEGLIAGAVQITPAGEPIVMLADHPTTGGYPVIGVVDPFDLPIVAQAMPGSTIRFDERRTWIGWRSDGASHLRPRERIRSDVYVAGPAPVEPRRGRPLPVPSRRVVGTQLQRVPAERGAAVPRRRIAPGVRDARMRFAVRPRRARQGGGADPRAAGRLGRAAPRRGIDPGHHLPVQEQHRFGRQLLRLPRELPDEP